MHAGVAAVRETRGPASAIDALQHAPTPSSNVRRLRQQADDEERFVREIEEEPGMHEDAVLLEQRRATSVLLAARRRHAQDRRTSRRRQRSTSIDGCARRPRWSARVVAPDARRGSASRTAAPARDRGAGAATCTGVETDRYVSADQLEPLQRLATSVVRAVDAPSIRASPAAGRPTSTGRRAGSQATGRHRRPSSSVAAAADNRRTLRRRSARRRGRRSARRAPRVRRRSMHRAGRVVRADREHARAPRRVHARSSAVEIDRPAAVILEAVRHGARRRRARSGDRRADSSAPGISTASPAGLHSSLNSSAYASLVLAVSTMRSGSMLTPRRR